MAVKFLYLLYLAKFNQVLNQVPNYVKDVKYKLYCVFLVICKVIVET